MVPKIQGRATSFLWYPSFPKYFHSDPAFRWALHPPPDLDLSLHFKLLHFFSQLPCFNRDKHCNSSPSFLSSIYCLNTFAKPCNPSDSAIPSSLVCLNFASLHHIFSSSSNLAILQEDSISNSKYAGDFFLQLFHLVYLTILFFSLKTVFFNFQTSSMILNHQLLCHSILHSRRCSSSISNLLRSFILQCHFSSNWLTSLPSILSTFLKDSQSPSPSFHLSKSLPVSLLILNRQMSSNLPKFLTSSTFLQASPRSRIHQRYQVSNIASTPSSNFPHLSTQFIPAP